MEMDKMKKLPEKLVSIGQTSELAAKFFEGNSYLSDVVNDPRVDVGIANVIQEPASRTNWHVHKNGYQILLVTKGCGLYQEEGHEIRVLSPGDVVVTHPDIKHWHGAAENEWFEHLAITKGNVQWLEAVSSEAFEAI